MIDWDLAIKALATIPGLYAIYRGVKELQVGRASQYRAEYEFAKKFLLEDVESIKDPYLRKMGFTALIGKQGLSPPEVEYLLKFEDSPTAVTRRKHCYSRAISFVNDPKDDLPPLRLTKQFSPKWRRGMAIAICGIGYFSFFELAFALILFPSLILPEASLLARILLSAACLSYGLYCLIHGIAIGTAARLVDDQPKIALLLKSR